MRCDSHLRRPIDLVWESGVDGRPLAWMSLRRDASSGVFFSYRASTQRGAEMRLASCLKSLPVVSC